MGDVYVVLFIFDHSKPFAIIVHLHTCTRTHGDSGCQEEKAVEPTFGLQLSTEVKPQLFSGLGAVNANAGHGHISSVEWGLV